MASHLVAEDLMTREVQTLHEEDNLLDVARRMDTFRFRHLPVEDEGKLVGLVTDRDILRLAGSALDSSVVAHVKETQLEEKTFVADVMTRDVQTISPLTPIAEAARMMLDAKIGCLPVVDG